VVVGGRNHNYQSFVREDKNLIPASAVHPVGTQRAGMKMECLWSHHAAPVLFAYCSSAIAVVEFWVLSHPENDNCEKIRKERRANRRSLYGCLICFRAGDPLGINFPIK
jgi:hypothetical protein